MLLPVMVWLIGIIEDWLVEFKFERIDYNLS